MEYCPQPERDAKQRLLANAAKENALIPLVDALNKGAKPNVTCDGSTALHVAAASDSFEVAQYLLSVGADPGLTDARGRTPLALARTPLMRDLLDDEGAYIADYHQQQHRRNHQGDEVMREVRGEAILNAEGQTALTMAAKNGFTDIVRLLLDRGVCIYPQRKQWDTALYEADVAGHIQIVNLLLDRWVLMNHSDLQSALIQAARYGHVEVVRLLLDRGAQINGSNQRGRTALIFAQLYGHEDTVWLLLDRGALRTAITRIGSNYL